MNELEKISIAVLIPCYNEERTVAAVVQGFRTALPHSKIYVYDNNSSDGTKAAATAAGAIVRSETRQGKGSVIRRMFADIDADVYVMVDGDATYPPDHAPQMVEALLSRQLDMVVGARKAMEKAAYRKNHVFGNLLFTRAVGLLFGQGLNDIFSGYRVFSRRFVKSFPALSGGFEIETELSVHTLELGLPFAEIDVPYGARPEGSVSKLNTWGDGARIAWMIARLFKQVHPLTFFTCIALVLFALGVVLGIPLVVTWLDTGLVPRIPTAIVVVGLGIISGLSLFLGLILHGIAALRHENRKLHYLLLSRTSG